MVYTYVYIYIYINIHTYTHTRKYLHALQTTSSADVATGDELPLDEASAAENEKQVTIFGLVSRQKFCRNFHEVKILQKFSKSHLTTPLPI